MQPVEYWHWCCSKNCSRGLNNFSFVRVSKIIGLFEADDVDLHEADYAAPAVLAFQLTLCDEMLIRKARVNVLAQSLKSSLNKEQASVQE
jgi:hypothetical protein